MRSCENFATRLNQVLDSLEFPTNSEDRERTFCEYFGVPLQKSHMILSGNLIPNKSLINKIADEFFLDCDELVGE